MVKHNRSVIIFDIADYKEYLLKNYLEVEDTNVDKLIKNGVYKTISDDLGYMTHAEDLDTYAIDNRFSTILKDISDRMYVVIVGYLTKLIYEIDCYLVKIIVINNMVILEIIRKDS